MSKTFIIFFLTFFTSQLANCDAKIEAESQMMQKLSKQKISN